MKKGPKHKLCRRIGSCVWGNPKCPSAKRPYPAGSAAKTRRKKLSTYGELLIEKQKLRAHYALNERQLRFAYQKAKTGTGSTPEKLLRNLELRLASVVFRSGLAPSIFAAKQAVSHRHVRVDGNIINRSGCLVKPGQVVSINSEKSPSIATIAQKTDVTPPSYLEVDKANCKVQVTREPLLEEIPANVEIMRVVEYYAR
ncbi:MAG: 30S ribosomal protein S4 [Candidatus Pacebacteria bacterium]|nr:30S ribosomal protein S4 [Candidatus Paceibacterota bacterium]